MSAHSSDDKKEKLSTSRVLSTGGRREASPPKVLLKKNLQLFQIKIFFDDDFKESVKVTNVQIWDFRKSWTISKFSGGACPRTTLEGQKNFFLAAAWLKHLFQDWLPFPKQKILDRILASMWLISTAPLAGMDECELI